jgi:hypothetical protein
MAYSINTWYHFKIEFDCSTDTWDIYINGVLKIDDASFSGDASYIDRIDYDNELDAESYYDAFGYSWDPNYTSGDNWHYDYYLGSQTFENYNTSSYGDYYGTYSFTDDTVGGNPAGWSVGELGGTVNVVAEKDDHKKVLELYDDDAVNGVIATNSFAIQTDATVEFWWAHECFSSYQHYLEMRFREGGTERVKILFSYTAVGQIVSHDGSAYVSIVTGLSINTFYHIEIVFDD